MSTEQSRPSRRYYILFTLLLLPVLLTAASYAIDWTDWNPPIWVYIANFWVRALCLLILPIWFFFFSGFAWRTRLACVRS